MATILALVLVLIVIGSVLFHLLSPWWSTPIASNWDYIDNTVILTFWITGIVFIASFCSWPIASSASATGRAGGRPMSRKTIGSNGRSRS